MLKPKKRGKYKKRKKYQVSPEKSKLMKERLNMANKLMKEGWSRSDAMKEACKRQNEAKLAEDNKYMERVRSETEAANASDNRCVYCQEPIDSDDDMCETCKAGIESSQPAEP